MKLKKLFIRFGAESILWITAEEGVAKQKYNKSGYKKTLYEPNYIQKVKLKFSEVFKNLKQKMNTSFNTLSYYNK